MPTYEYVCIPNDHRFELFQRIGEEPPAGCVQCGGPIRKVFHPAGIVFKGSGFYKTDSRKAASGTKSSKSDPSEPAKKSGDASGDAKAGTASSTEKKKESGS